MPNEPSGQPERTPLSSKPEAPLTAELIAQVTDKVYALLLQDLTLERERSPTVSGLPPSRGRSGFGHYGAGGGW
jgi:hypothetical protein